MFRSKSPIGFGPIQARNKVTSDHFHFSSAGLEALTDSGTFFIQHLFTFPQQLVLVFCFGIYSCLSFILGIGNINRGDKWVPFWRLHLSGKHPFIGCCDTKREVVCCSMFISDGLKCWRWQQWSEKRGKTVSEEGKKNATNEGSGGTNARKKLEDDIVSIAPSVNCPFYFLPEDEQENFQQLLSDVINKETLHKAENNEFKSLQSCLQSCLMTGDVTTHVRRQCTSVCSNSDELYQTHGTVDESKTCTQLLDSGNIGKVEYYEGEGRDTIIYKLFILSRPMEI